MHRLAACCLAVSLAVVPATLAQNVVAPSNAPMRVSAGVMAGQLVTKAAPVYPPEAKAAKVQGAVVMHAIIGKTGVVEELVVISGPEVLRASALDAVRQWTYKPYLLNGNPVEVDTTITVNYSLNQPIQADSLQDGVMDGTPNGAPPALAPLPPGRIRVSAGVMATLIDTKKTPVYPEDAKAAHITGAVVLSGVIDTHGKVSDLNVVSGPELLRQAAMDAVSQWIYKPYLLNGKPVEVVTTMTVHFMLID
jgi:TonB family protein